MKHLLPDSDFCASRKLRDIHQKTPWSPFRDSPAYSHAALASSRRCWSSCFATPWRRCDEAVRIDLISACCGSSSLRAPHPAKTPASHMSTGDVRRAQPLKVLRHGTFGRRHPIHVHADVLVITRDLRSAHIARRMSIAGSRAHACLRAHSAGGALAPGDQAVHGRRHRKTPRRIMGTNAHPRRRWDERHNGIP